MTYRLLYFETKKQLLANICVLSIVIILSYALMQIKMILLIYMSYIFYVILILKTTLKLHI